MTKRCAASPAHDSDRALWSGPIAIQRQLPFPSTNVQEKSGAVYTKPWVVELILDLAGYTADTNLVDAVAVEPAAGYGAFLVPMIRRLLASCHMQRRSILDCAGAAMAFELDDTSADKARAAVSAVLRSVHASEHEIDILLEAWIRSGNYLLEAPTLPRADYVIGNPPYIRLEDMDDEAGRIYRATYHTMVGRADIYIAFFEAALRQLAPGGACAFICADRWMLNQYGAQLRRFITASFAVEAIVEMHRAPAFESDVSAYPAVIVIRRGKQGSVVVAQAGEVAATIGVPALMESIRSVQNSTNDVAEQPGIKVARVADWFHGDEPWSRASPEQLALLKHLEAHFPLLESEETGTKVGIGVATGLDDVFITTEPVCIEESRLLPLAMAADVTSGQLRWSGHYLVNPWTPDGLVDLTMFPKLCSYYGRHQERLMTRHVAKRRPRQWYRTIGNNFNNRVEEAIGSAHDIWTAYREGRLGAGPRPFLGYFFLLEDCKEVQIPVRNQEPYFPSIQPSRMPPTANDTKCSAVAWF